MKVYSPPVEIGEPPALRGSLPDTQVAEDAWLDGLRNWCKDRSKHRLAGKMIYLPIADGAAQYMVLNGTTLIHVPLGDAWHVPDYQTRGLRVSDLERMAL
jgi:hypothetical protein